MVLRNVINYSDGSQYCYQNGKKDAWQVVYINKSGQQHIYFDKEYLDALRGLGEKYGVKALYSLFNIIFELVENNALCHDGKPKPTYEELVICHNVAQVINNKITVPGVDVKKLLDCLYLTMISEWYYKGSILHHRVKRLAVYQVLLQSLAPKKAANFSRGKSVKELKALMKQYNI